MGGQRCACGGSDCLSTRTEGRPACERSDLGERYVLEFREQRYPGAHGHHEQRLRDGGGRRLVEDVQEDREGQDAAAAPQQAQHKAHGTSQPRL